MAEIILSDVMKKQTELAWQYLEKARPLITYEKLVPVPEALIEKYEHHSHKIVPADYRYWLTTYGSGRIEFLDGELPIVSIFELMKICVREITVEDPQNCWERINISCPAARDTLFLDSTIIDDNGCAPVILTKTDSYEVEKVLSSSWPMYVIKSIIDSASCLKDRGQTGSYTAEQVKVIEELASQNIKLIDDALGNASERAKAHNNVKNANLDVTSLNNELSGAFFGSYKEHEYKEKSEGIRCRWFQKFDFSSSYKPDLPAGRRHQVLYGVIVSLFTSFNRLAYLLGCEDDVTKMVKKLEDRIDKGYAFLDNDYQLISEFPHKLELRHKILVKSLHNHDRRELRMFADKGWLRINPGEAEKQSKRMWDWLNCAENWVVLYRSRNNAVRCLREAEKAASDFIEWRACAEFWLDEIHNASEARRCLLIAEQNVENSDHRLSKNLVDLSRVWIDLNDLEKARKNLLLAEEVTGQSYVELIWASQYWRKDLKDSEAAKRCLRKAESLVPNHHAGCLRDMLKEWQLIGDMEEVESFKARNDEYLKG